ncbi:MAG TPA: type II secretion system F family protein [Burkholderiaceae bacterium]
MSIFSMSILSASILYYALIFASVAAGAYGVLALLGSMQTQHRMRQIAPPAQKGDWLATVVSVVGPFAKLSSPSGDWESSPLRIRFISAGLRSENAPLIYFGMKTLLPLVFAAACYLLLRMSGAELERNVMLFVLVSVATVGCYIPNMVLRRLIARRQREIFDNFPDAADLMLVCVEAGLGLDAALARVAEEIRIKSVPLAQELHLTNLEIRAGNAREHALRNLAARTAIDEVGTFVSMLIQADKFGTSVGASMRVFSEELRQKRQIRAEELAAKVSTKMLFPLVLCIFPAISMVVLGPALIRIANSILPMIAGQNLP